MKDNLDTQILANPSSKTDDGEGNAENGQQSIVEIAEPNEKIQMLNNSSGKEAVPQSVEEVPGQLEDSEIPKTIVEGPEITNVDNSEVTNAQDTPSNEESNKNNEDDDNAYIEHDTQVVDSTPDSSYDTQDPLEPEVEEENIKEGAPSPPKQVTTYNSKRRIVAIIIAMLVAVGFVIYFSFFRTTLTKSHTAKVGELLSTKMLPQSEMAPIQPFTTQNNSNLATTKLIPPALEQPTPSAAPPPMPSLPTTPVMPTIPEAPVVQPSSHTSTVISLPSDSNSQSVASNLATPNQQNGTDAAKKIAARRSIASMIFGGGSGDDETKSINNNGSDYLGFDGGAIDKVTLSKSSAVSNIATRVTNLPYTILQGKIIEAVLETAINTALPGSLRALVTRDVFAEYGKNILIPKGSRLIGSYGNATIKPGQARIAIIWSRLITPYGIDMQLDSMPGTDALGRAGVAGDLHSRILEQLGAAILVSYIVPLIAAEVSDPNSTVTQTVTPAGTTTTSGTTGTTTGTNTSTTTNNNTSTTTTGTAKSMALASGTQEFVSRASDMVQQEIPQTPIVTINQGTRITIFAQKDLVFPSEAVAIIQSGNQELAVSP